jgi:hypothetical protein
MYFGTVYRVPTKPASCGILQVFDGYTGHGGQYAAFHEGCHCSDVDVIVCKVLCDNDEQCKGYFEVSEGYEMSKGCRTATTSHCNSGCFKTDNGNVGDLIQDQSYGDAFLGCFVRTKDASGKH